MNELIFKKKVLHKKNMEETVFLNCSASSPRGAFLHLWNVGKSTIYAKEHYAHISKNPNKKKDFISNEMLFCCAKNYCNIEYENGRMKMVSPYTVCYYGNHRGYGYEMDGEEFSDSCRYYISIERNVYIQHFFNLDEVMICRITPLERPYKLLEEIFSMAENSSSYTALDMSVKLFEFLSVVSTGITRKTEKTGNIKALLEYVSVFPQKYSTIKDLTELFHVSEITLHNIFRRETGKSPMEYVIYHRLYSSCWKLMQTSMPIGEIARLSGYNSVQFYSRSFKKVFGVSPAKYRQNSLLASTEKLP